MARHFFTLRSRSHEKLFEHLEREGGQGNYLEHLMTRKDIYSLIDYHQYEEPDNTIAKSVVP